MWGEGNNSLHKLMQPLWKSVWQFLEKLREHSNKMTPKDILLYPYTSGLLRPHQRMGINPETHNWRVCWEWENLGYSDVLIKLLFSRLGNLCRKILRARAGGLTQRNDTQMNSQILWQIYQGTGNSNILGSSLQHLSTLEKATVTCVFWPWYILRTWV